MRLQPDNFVEEKTTVWSFPNRGNWATHSGRYRGNWSPYVPRNLILKYTKPGEWILDQFMGSGTTLIEAKLLNRHAIGVDINENSLHIASENLKFNAGNNTKILLRKGNAAKLDFIKDNSIDFICTHPPYSDIIAYSEGIKGDLSLLKTEDFLLAMEDVARETFRILKYGKKCAVMMGDIRKNRKVVPLGFYTMGVFIKAGLCLKEIIIKKQHNCMSTKYWENRNNDFYLLAHEYIFVFEKACKE